VSRARREFGHGAALCLAAAGGLVVEIVAGRLVAPYAGMSLYTWTSIIAVVLAGFSIGNWWGGILADSADSDATASFRVASAFAFAAATTLAALILLRVLAPVLLAPGWPPIAGILALAACLFLAPSLCVGIVSPIITKLAIAARPDAPGRMVGRMFALGAIGSIVGTLAAGFIAIPFLGSTMTMLAVAGLYGALALAFAINARALRTLSAMLVILAPGMAFAGRNLDAFVSPCHDESAYHCIRVDDFTRTSGRPSRVMVLDHLAHGINDRDDPGLLHSSYLHFVDAFTRARFADGLREALVIGGGALTLPRAWLAGGDANILVAEIDPAVTRAAIARLWAEPAARLNVAHVDGRMLLAALPRAPRFDVIFGDAFQDVSIPPHLVTREFHAEVAARLSARGVYAVNVIEGGERPLFLWSLVRTLRMEFASVEVWADSEDLRGRGRVTFVVVASAAPSPADRMTDARGYRREWRRIEANALTRSIAASGAPVLTDDFAPVDRLMAHITLEPSLAGR
jgi:predicted membrane-bound spermidine synthase